MGLIFVASGQPDAGRLGRVPDWLSHGMAYLVLGLLLGRALAGGFDRRLAHPQALLLVILGTAYGIGDEVHQAFVPGRDASGWDVLKDLAGCALAALLLRLRGPSLVRRQT
jgi:VanZ family protein